MKKLLLCAAMIAFGLTANAQEGKLNVGGTVGLPTGGASEANVTGAVEVNYLLKATDKFMVGPSVSHLHFQQEGADVAFIPLAAAFRYEVADKLFVGADLGYGLGVRPSKSTVNGVYYRPVVGYQVSKKIMLHVDYSVVDIDERAMKSTLSTVGIGGTYSFSL
ncbi:conserved exported hypothetical protein [Tenacibaculum maritimum]|uniref:outer membrane beta-barrel protein n=1 Tax=Tenacibaculum maritimum TaxID=107401 RepID=UPI0012E645F9|nr:outer membrane beta-barrel protein [Tenacibaculum maritimum]CAA0140576.1 conserved exported hypothetical protein [Tenacibaculum maritimum]CAA0140577.1 conserved exported hypothetical protein [Tenacibaculum maritimum]CAA0140585.1 conserved exported hypothetical protein [Tenacibaculum maritimum]